MFFFLILSVLSTKLTIVATDVNGANHDFATVEYQEKSNIGKITPASDEIFENNFIKTFQLTRPDGEVLSFPSPANTKSLLFKFYILQETPVMVEASTSYRRQGLQVLLSRSRNMQSPNYQKFEAAEEGGMFSMIKKFLPLLLILFVASAMKGGAAPPAK